MHTHELQGMLPSTMESKTTYYRYPTFYPPPPTATAVPPQVTPTSTYLPTAAAMSGLFPLSIFNRGPIAPAQFSNGTSTPPATLYTLYPPHANATSGQCSCTYCTTAAAPMAALSPCTLPLLSGLNTSLPPGVLKYEKETPSQFTRLTHVTEVAPIPQPLTSTGVAATVPTTLNNGLPISSPQQQGPQEMQTPTIARLESMAASRSSPSNSNNQPVTQLQQPALPNTSPCPTLPTSSESASTAIGYNHDVCETAIAGTLPDQHLCALNPIVYDLRRGTKPLFHLPANHLEPVMMTTTLLSHSASQGNTQLPPQWLWNSADTASSQPLYEAALPELPKSPSNSIEGEESSYPPSQTELDPARSESSQAGVEEAN